LHTPYNRVHCCRPSKPNAPSTEGTSVTVSNVTKGALDELAHVSGAASKLANDCGYVNECMPHFAMTAQSNEGREAAESKVDWCEESACCWQDTDGVLKVAHNGAEAPERDPLLF
jgi:hypothetical protein